ncbi:MAG: protein kinase [Planctomycetes bacterium]|nr:protein kinase [Planctomycetota bacterium]
MDETGPQPATDAGRLPDELEDRAYEILLDLPEASRDVAFDALLDAQPLHRPALLRLRQSLRGAETALTGAGLADAPAPAQLGPYTLLQKLGEGGFGVVYLGEQHEPLHRQVAIKLIRPGMDSAAVLRRFEAERDVLTRFDHPGIARVLDAGALDDGRPYLVTEYVAGEPITAHCDRLRLGLRARVQLLLRVCEGVQHAHQRGVIHRDLKPSNVLVTQRDGEATPKLIDFGIARALVGGATAAERTLAGSLLGTPEYMSPEQAEGSLDVDIRTDVYALGVLCYELFVGDLPQPRARWREAGISELVELIRTTQAPRPSSRASDPARARELRDELDWVVLRALEKDRTRRYPTVAALAADLEAWLAHRPVVAHPPRLAYQLRCYVRRHRTPVLAAAVAVLSLGAGIVFGLVQWRRADTAARETSAALERYLTVADIVRRDALEREAATLFPAESDARAAYGRWLAAADRLLERSAAIEATRARLRQSLAAPVDPRSADADGFLLAQLDAHATALARFAGERGPRAEIERRLAWATSARARTLDAVRADWEAASSRIAESTRYGGLLVTPQLGLVPLGPDPATGFEEFVALQTGEVPTRDAEGRLVLEPRHGVVLVLLPGGSFRMGSQGSDPTAPNYDPQPAAGLGVVTELTLEPFFIGKHELTRAQWERFCGEDPSFTPKTDRPGLVIDGRHPVENLDWRTADATLRRMDLVLPTEAQWEYACRAGTHSLWSTGSEPESLAGHANLAGREARLIARQGVVIDERHEDAWLFSNPIDALRANAFGLHDLHGNVAEWVRDAAQRDATPPRRGDGLREARSTDEVYRCLRGGSSRDTPLRAKSALRNIIGESVRVPFCGVRAARALMR